MNNKDRKLSCLVKKKLQERKKEEKKNSSSIHSEVEKIISKEIILDYSTNKKVNVKFILNKYLSIITYLTKENLNLKKIIEKNQSENNKINDTIIKYENELRHKEDIITKMTENMKKDLLYEDIHKREDVNLCGKKDIYMGNIEMVKAEGEEKYALKKENNNGEHISIYHIRNNERYGSKNMKNNPLNDKIENFTFTQDGGGIFAEKDREGECVLLKEQQSQKGTIESAQKRKNTMGHYDNIEDVNKHGIVNAERLNTQFEGNFLTNTNEAQSKFANDKENGINERKFQNNSLNHFLNDINKSSSNDVCMDELNYLLSNGTQGNNHTSDNQTEIEEQFEHVEKFIRYHKKCKEEYNNIYSVNFASIDQSTGATKSEGEIKASENSMHATEKVLNNLAICIDLPKQKSINRRTNNFEYKKDIIYGKNNALMDLQICETSCNNDKAKKEEDCMNAQCETAENINSIKKRSTVALKKENTMNPETNNVNNESPHDNHCDHFDKTDLDFSEMGNKNDWEDDNYEDLENIMSTILKLRKKT
ncbi:conserved Plasmodium protein, unknown function [Plasmodium ovale wallikeri]|uniref:Uncharacterized protein n=2 Tax=Plasmodium ovale TaxID=36330 RepID=A0A1A8ZXS2_PLAOA|nr:conserved Plasmodium protein, unknown function [Plasmodium ovale wallikeri]SBT49076.1 conserved Plasmodium protein, unknown function [Plasmodium ovale wallikeri]SBT82524.1 conserved Plasmodium protein, unknown function [Plasmodium ovale]